jgi:hypothetical protein
MQDHGFTHSDEILEKPLTLNLELAKQEKRSEPVIDPWAL